MSTAQDRTTRIKFLISEQNQPLPCCSKSTILDNYGIFDISGEAAENVTLLTSQIAVNVSSIYTLGFGIAIEPVSGTEIYLQVTSNIDGPLYSTGAIPISATTYEAFTTDVSLTAGVHTITLTLLANSDVTGQVLGGYLAMFRA